MLSLYLTLLVLGSISSVFFWQWSGAFVNWFWQDEKDEAKMIIADKRANMNYSKELSFSIVAVIVAMVAASGSLLYFNDEPSFIFFIKGLMILYFIFIGLVDFRTMMLPDILNYIGLWSGLILACFNLNPLGLSLQACVLGAFGCYVISWLIVQFGYRVVDKVILGHGDAKYLAMLGAIFGFKLSYLILVLSMISVSLFTIIRYLFTKGGNFNQKNPFGPFLSFSAINMLIFYQPIIDYVHSIYPSLF